MTDGGIINDIFLRGAEVEGVSGVCSVSQKSSDCGSEVCSAGGDEERPSDNSGCLCQNGQDTGRAFEEGSSELYCGGQTAVQGEVDDSGEDRCLCRGGYKADIGVNDTRVCNELAQEGMGLRQEGLDEVSREYRYGDMGMLVEYSRTGREDASSGEVDREADRAADRSAADLERKMSDEDDTNAGDIVPSGTIAAEDTAPDFIKSSLMADDSDKIASTLGFDEEIPNLDQKKEDVSTVNLGNTANSSTSDNKVIRFAKSDVGLGIIASVVLLVLSIIYRVKIANIGEVVINVGESTAMLKLCMVYLGSVLSTLGMFLLAPAGIIGNLVSIKVPTKLMKLLNYGLIVFAFLLLVCIFI